MKNLKLTLLFFLAFSASLFAQKYPYDFPVDTTISGSENVHWQNKSGGTYSSYNLPFPYVKRYMSPNVVASPIGFQPDTASTGQKYNYLGKFVTDPSGIIWYIDGQGLVLEIGDPAGGGGGVSTGDKGDIDVVNASTDWRVDTGAITTIKLASDAVTAAKIGAGEVGASEIATDAVGSAEIATGAVTTTEILDGTVALGDLAFTPLTAEVDGSTTNELQTIANTSDATSHTVTLSNSGGTVQLVEGSNILLTTSGTSGAGVVTIAATGGSAGAIVGNQNTAGDTLTGGFQKIIFDTNNGNFIARNNGTPTQIGMENGFNVMLSNAVTSSGTSFPVNLASGTVFAHTLTSATATVANPTNAASGRFGIPYRLILKNASGAPSTVTFSSSYNKKDKTDVGAISVAADDSLIYNFQLENNAGAWVMTSMDDLGGASGSGDDVSTFPAATNVTASEKFVLTGSDSTLTFQKLINQSLDTIAGHGNSQFYKWNNTLPTYLRGTGEALYIAQLNSDTTAIEIRLQPPHDSTSFWRANDVSLNRVDTRQKQSTTYSARTGTWSDLGGTGGSRYRRSDSFGATMTVQFQGNGIYFRPFYLAEGGFAKFYIEGLSDTTYVDTYRAAGGMCNESGSIYTEDFDCNILLFDDLPYKTYNLKLVHADSINPSNVSGSNRIAVPGYDTVVVVNSLGFINNHAGFVSFTEDIDTIFKDRKIRQITPETKVDEIALRGNRYNSGTSTEWIPSHSGFSVEDNISKLLLVDGDTVDWENAFGWVRANDVQFFQKLYAKNPHEADSLIIWTIEHSFKNSELFVNQELEFIDTFNLVTGYTGMFTIPTTLFDTIYCNDAARTKIAIYDNSDLDLPIPGIEHPTQFLAKGPETEILYSISNSLYETGTRRNAAPLTFRQNSAWNKLYVKGLNTGLYYPGETLKYSTSYLFRSTPPTGWTKKDVANSLDGDVTVSNYGKSAGLNNTSVTPGTYTNTTVTVRQDGRIESISNGASGIPSSGTTPFLPYSVNADSLADSALRNITGGTQLNSTSGPSIYSFTTAPQTADAAGTNLAIHSLNTSASAVKGTIGIRSELLAHTSGNQATTYVEGLYYPTSGTANFATMKLFSQYNQTGGANGRIAGLEFDRSAISASSTYYDIYASVQSYLGLSMGINGQAPPSAAIHMGGGIGAIRTATAWGLNGVGLRVDAVVGQDNSTAASGTATNAVIHSFAVPQLRATNATVTTTNAANVYIAGAPSASTNQTITNAYSFWVDAGATRLDGQVLLGGTGSPSASSLLDIQSTTQGFLQPRMTTTQRNAISSPATGLQVYNTSLNKLNYYNGSSWLAVIDSVTAAGYFKSGANTLTANTTFNGTFDWRMGNTTALDTVEIIGARALLGTATNRWSIGSDFSRLWSNGIVAFQSNNTTGALAMVLPDNTATAMSIAISSGNNFLLFNSTDGAEKLTVGSSSAGATVDITGSTKFDNRTQLLQGADVASASTIALTSGNSFELTGTTAVTLITSTGWQEGSQITLIANGNVTITNGTATSGADVTIKLAGASNFAMTADDTLTLILSSTTAGGVAWREVCRTAN